MTRLQLFDSEVALKAAQEKLAELQAASQLPTEQLQQILNARPDLQNLRVRIPLEGININELDPREKELLREDAAHAILNVIKVYDEHTHH